MVAQVWRSRSPEPRGAAREELGHRQLSALAVPTVTWKAGSASRVNPKEGKQRK